MNCLRVIIFDLLGKRMGGSNGDWQGEGTGYPKSSKQGEQFVSYILNMCCFNLQTPFKVIYF